MDMKEVISALGPLGPLYTDPTVLSIMVDSPTQVYVEREGGLEDVEVSFDSPEGIRRVIDDILRLGGITLDRQKTTGEVRLPDDARLVAVIPPTAVDGPNLTIRKVTTSGTLDWDKLVDFGSITREAVNVLQKAILAHLNFLVVGDADAGKLTVVNIMARDIPEDQRLLVIEETTELRIKHPRFVRMESGGPANPSVVDLLRTGKDG
jgi:pilus assembly protein CpaF